MASESGVRCFAIVFAAFLYFGAVHTGLITEPMLVFGPGRFAKHGGYYLRRLAKGHVGFALVSAAILLSAGALVWQLGSRPLASAVFALAVAQGFILML